MRSDTSSPVGVVRAGLAALTSADVVGLPDEQVRGQILDLLQCLNQLSAALAQRIDSFDVRDLACTEPLRFGTVRSSLVPRCDAPLRLTDALRTSTTWLTAFAGMSKGAAQRWLAYGRCLRQLPALAEGMRAGSVSAEQLDKVCDLGRRIGLEQVARYDRILAALCASGGPADVARACERILALEDPDGAEPDPAEDFGRREIVFSQLGSMLYIRGRLDPEGAAALQAAVDALMAPPKLFDERSTGQRRADAMVDLAKAAMATGALPEVGGQRPHVGILITPELLLACPSGSAGSLAGSSGASAGTVATGACGGDDPLSAAGVPELAERPWLTWAGHVCAELAQRLACDGVIWRLVLDPRTGLPLNLGRSHRIVPAWMRKALWARDRHCRWPGCDAPAQWTDAHHIVAWWQGGTTDIGQLISLCRYHHGKVHEGRWKLTVDHATGEVWVTRPDGRPYELGPSRPWTSPARQGPQPHAPPLPDAA